jgi:DNA modification methylase
VSVQLLSGDCRAVLPNLPDTSVQAVITSPPYWQLRSYLDKDHRYKGLEIGTEPLHDCAAAWRNEPPCGDCYVCTLRSVFADVWRVLRDDGVVFLNLGDSYASSGKGDPDAFAKMGANLAARGHRWSATGNGGRGRAATPNGLKPKDLIGIPWRVALALQSDGWYLRSDVIWSKPNPMPESVTDRPTRSHEYIFVLSKRATYYWDQEAIREPHSPKTEWTYPQPDKAARAGVTKNGTGASSLRLETPNGRNRRSVWTVATQAYKGSHFAVFPERLIEPMVLAGTSPQACETCAAPWARVVERGNTDAQRIGGPKTTIHSPRHDGNGAGGFYPTFDTTGWRPTCACETNTGAGRCVILDPFGGSGTVAKIAIKHRRAAILIDLSSDYAALQYARTNGVQIQLFDEAAS